MIECAEPGCDRFYSNHKWGAVKAHEAGWFQQKDGNSWCPDHVPAWVSEWRKGKGK